MFNAHASWLYKILEKSLLTLVLAAIAFAFLAFSLAIADPNTIISSNPALGNYTIRDKEGNTIKVSDFIISAADAIKLKPGWDIAETTRLFTIEGVTGSNRISGEYGEIHLTEGHPLTIGSGNLYLAGIKGGNAGDGTRPILLVHDHKLKYVIQMEPTAGSPATLHLEDGILNGNILMNPLINDPTILTTSIGPGGTAGTTYGDVIINGNIDVDPSATGESSVIAAAGRKLEINGDIGHNGIPITNVSADGADLVLKQNTEQIDGQSEPSYGNIVARNLSATNGHIAQAGNTQIYPVTKPKMETITIDGITGTFQVTDPPATYKKVWDSKAHKYVIQPQYPTGADGAPIFNPVEEIVSEGYDDWTGSLTVDKITIGAGSKVEGKNATINNTIGGSSANAGSMEGDASLIAHGGEMLLKGGVESASGTIATQPILYTSGGVKTPGGDIISQSSSGAYQPINQGSGSLAIAADSGIHAGPITVTSATAANGNITAHAAGSTDSSSRSDIIANTVAAPKGAVNANNLTLPLNAGQAASLHADNLQLAASLNFTGGEFNLTGASHIQGDATITNATGQEGGLGGMTVDGTFKVENSDLSGPGDLHLGNVDLNGAKLAATNLYMKNPLEASTMRNGSALVANDGNVYLFGGVEGGDGTVAATQGADATAASAGNIYAYTQASASDPTGGQPMEINQGAGSLALEAANDIKAGNITVASLKSGKDISVDGSLNLTGPGQSSIGGNLSVADNTNTKVGDLTIGGSMVARGGSLTGENITASTIVLADGLKATIGSFTLGDSPDSSLWLGESPSDNVDLTVGTLNTVNGSLNALGGDVLIKNDFSGAAVSVGQGHKVEAAGDINIKSVNLDNASLSGASVDITNLASMTGDSRLTANSGDIYLRGGANPASGAITALMGSIYGQSAGGKPQDIIQGAEPLDLVAGKNISAGEITANSLQAGGNVSARNSLILTGNGQNTIGGDLAISPNELSRVGELSVGGKFTAESGTFSGGDISAGSAQFLDGAVANINTFKLTSPNGVLQAGTNGADSPNLAFNSLDLGKGTLEANGGNLTTDTLTGGNAAVANNASVKVSGEATLDSLSLSGAGASFAASTANIGDLTASGLTYLNFSNLSGNTLTVTDGANVRAENSLSEGNIVANSSGAISATTLTAKSLAASDNATVTASFINSDSIHASGDAMLKAANITSQAIGLSGRSSMMADTIYTDTLDMRDQSQLVAFSKIELKEATIAPGASLRTADMAVLKHAHISGTVSALTETIVENTIEGDGLANGATIEGEKGVMLEGGVKEATGTIKAGASGFITAGTGIGDYEDILQGDGHLTLIAGMGIYANNINADSVTSENYNIDTRTVDKMGSITSPLISAVKGYIHSGDIVSQGAEEKPALVEARQLEAANLAIDNGSLQLSGDTVNVIDKDLAITNNRDSYFTGMEVGGNASVSGGSLKAESLAAGSLDFSDLEANIANIRANGAANITGGSLSSDFFQADSANFENADASVGSFSVSNNASLSGGKFAADTFSANTATFTNGIQAQAGSLVMNGPAQNLLVITNTPQASQPTSVTLDSLRFTPGSLEISSSPNQQKAMLAVKKIGKPDDPHATARGSIAVGANSLFTIGASDNSWLSSLVENGVVPGVSTGAAMAVMSSLRLGPGGSIYLDSSWRQNGAQAPGAGHISYGANTLLAIDASAANPERERLRYSGPQVNTADLPDSVPGAISSDSPMLAHISPEAKIFIKGVEAGYTYVVLGQNITTVYESGAARAATGNGWQGENLFTDNPLVKLERLEDGKEGQFGVVVEPLPPNIDPGHDPIINPPAPVIPEPVEPEPDAPVEPEPVAPLPPAPANPFLNQALWHAQRDPEEAGRTIENALRMPATAAIPQLARGASMAASDAIYEQRLGLFYGERPDTGDRFRPNYALWAVPLYRSLAGEKLEAGSLNYDYNGGLGGIVIGGDATWANNLRLGAMFNIGGGYAKSAGELDQTRNNMSFWGAGLYGGWQRGQFALSGDASFAATYNKVKQDLPGGYEWGSLKSDITAWTISAGLTAEYRFVTEYCDIAPHIGARYNHLNIDAWDVKGDGGPEVIHGDLASQDFWTFPVGIRFSKEWALGDKWRARPSADLSAIPVAGQKRIDTTLHYTGMAGDLDLSTQVMDDITWGGSAGIEFGAGDFALGISYSAQFGEHSQSQGVFGLVRYEF